MILSDETMHRAREGTLGLERCDCGRWYDPRVVVDVDHCDGCHWQTSAISGALAQLGDGGLDPMSHKGRLARRGLRRDVRQRARSTRPSGVGELVVLTVGIAACLVMIVVVVGVVLSR